MMFEVRGWRVEKGGKVFHNLERLNLNNPTLSRRDATEGSGRRRSVGIRVRHSISVSETRNHKTVSKVASLRDALVAVVHSSPHCAPLSLSVVLLR